MKRFKVAITDYSWRDSNIERRWLPKDVTIVERQCLTENEVIDLCKDADAILSEYAPISEYVLDNLTNCKIISNTATGYDNIDVEAAKKRGIVVSNVPSYCSEEVANHVWSLLLFFKRRLDCFLSEKSDWTLKEEPRLNRLSKDVLGLVGFGNIAREVALRAKAFNVRVIASTSVNQEILDWYNVKKVSLEELYEHATIISIHKPLNSETVGLVEDIAFKKMAMNPFLINTSRGKIIDESALIRALKQNRISGAALDVLESEPPEKGNPLYDFDNVFITPHIGFYSEEAIVEARKISSMNIRNYYEGRLDLIYSV